MSPSALPAGAAELAAAPVQTAVPANALTDEPGSLQLQLLERIASASREDLVLLSCEMFNGKPDFYMAGLLWERWIDLDPEGGFRALLGGELVTKDRMQQVWTYLGKWAARDPDAAVAKALILPEDRDTRVALSRICRQLAATRPADFFRHYPALSQKGDDATYCVQMAAAKLAARDPRTMVGLLDGSGAGLVLADTDKTKAWQGLASGWAQTDPQAALDFFRSLKDKEIQRAGLDKIAIQVIARDPDLAAEIIKGSQGADSFKKAAEALALIDPAAALAWLKQHLPEASAVIASELAREYIPRSAQAAVEYINRHSDVFGKGKIDYAPLSRWTVDDPAAALALTDSIGDHAARSNARILFLDLMAISSPQEAIEKAAAGPERNRILTRAVENWAKQDLTGASQWLAAEPAGLARDSAIYGLLSVTMRVEPESALPWAAAITHESERVEKLAWVLSRTNQRELNEVTAALRGFADTPDEIARIMDSLKMLDSLDSSLPTR